MSYEDCKNAYIENKNGDKIYISGNEKGVSLKDAKVEKTSV